MFYKRRSSKIADLVVMDLLGARGQPRYNGPRYNGPLTVYHFSYSTIDEYESCFNLNIPLHFMVPPKAFSIITKKNVVWNGQKQ